MTVSNEVLAERIEGYTRQTLAESQQVRKDLTAATEAMGRVQDAVTFVAENLSRHEQLEGHPVGMLKIGLLEKDAQKAKQDIDRLRELITLKEEVSHLAIVVGEVKSKQDARESFEGGQKSALSGLEKTILLLLASVGPFVLIIERV